MAGNLNRLARIQVVMDTTGVKKALAEIDLAEQDLTRKQIYHWRLRQQRAGQSADRRRSIDISLTRHKIKLAKQETEVAKRVISETEAAELRYVRRKMARDKMVADYHAKLSAMIKQEVREREAYMRAQAKQTAATRIAAERSVAAAVGGGGGRRYHHSGFGAFGSSRLPGGGMIYAGGAAGLGFSAALGAGFGAMSSGRHSLEQERSITRLMTLVSPEERSQGMNLEWATAQARALAMELGISVPKAAEAMREAITAAVSPLDSPGYVRGARALSIMEGADLNRTMTALTAVKNAYDLTAEQMQASMDVMFASVDEGRVKFDGLASQIGNLSGLARSAGFDFREMMAAIGVLTRQGMSPERAATSMRAASLQILKPPTARVEANRRRAGLLLTPESVTSQNIVQTIKDISEAMENFDMKVTDLIGGKARAAVFFETLRTNIQDLEDLYESQPGKFGLAMERGAEVIDDNLGRWDKMMTTVSIGWAKVGEQITGAFLDWAGTGSDFEISLLRIEQVFNGIATLVRYIVDSIRFAVWGAKSLNEIGTAIVQRRMPNLEGYDPRMESYQELLKQNRLTKLKLEKAQAIRAGGGNIRGMVWSDAKEDYVRMGGAVSSKEAIESLAKSPEEMAEAASAAAGQRAKIVFETHEETFKDLVKAFEKAEKEKTQILERNLNYHRGLVTKHLNSLKAAYADAAKFELTMADQVQTRRLEMSSVTDLQKYMAARRKHSLAQERAATLADMGAFDEAKEWNARAIAAADDLRQFDLVALSQTSAADQWATIKSMSGFDDPSVRGAERVSRFRQSQSDVHGAMRSLRELTARNRVASQSPDFSRKQSLKLMESDISKGRSIRERERESLRSMVDDAMAKMKSVEDTMASVEGIAARAAGYLSKGAEDFKKGMEDGVYALENVARMRSDLSMFAHLAKKVGNVEAEAVEGKYDGMVRALEALSQGGNTYHVTIQANDSAGGARAGEAFVQRVRQSLDRKEGTITPPK